MSKKKKIPSKKFYGFVINDCVPENLSEFDPSEYLFSTKEERDAELEEWYLASDENSLNFNLFEIKFTDKVLIEKQITKEVTKL